MSAQLCMLMPLIQLTAEIWLCAGARRDTWSLNRGPLRREVRVRHRLAELLGADGCRCGEHRGGPWFPDAPDRGALLDLRGTPRARVRGRSGSERPALLRQLGRVDV